MNKSISPIKPSHRDLLGAQVCSGHPVGRSISGMLILNQPSTSIYKKQLKLK